MIVYKMLNLFLHHRDLRIVDNTAMIEQLRHEKTCTPLFIFPPEQIDPVKNEYFSMNAVEFMIESLHELSDDIKKEMGGEGGLAFFHGDTLAVLADIHARIGICSLAWNIDYTPYAKRRDTLLRDFCKEKGIRLYEKEDYLLYDIVEGQTCKASDGTPYLVFTPFRNHCQTNLRVRKCDPFSTFSFFNATASLKKCKGYMPEKKINKFYKENPDIHVRGGRKRGLDILKNMSHFSNYDTRRDFFDYTTTSLSAYNHFSPISIREVYWTVHKKLGASSGILNELHWRDFYANITHFFPRVLQGQISNKPNLPFKEKYTHFPWEKNDAWFRMWCEGKTGYPLVDACMRQLNETGYMHNRGRMIVSMFLTKTMLLDFRLGEKYFARHLVDYSPMQNSGGWMWSSSMGTDSVPYFRTMNYITQAKKYDADKTYVNTWLPEGEKEAPMVDQKKQRDKMFTLFKGDYSQKR